ncbi:hypothetical protein VJ918_08155 [Adlercreutzia sp. R21]|uniref:hypothetical protein n=1 Tax=Adlercreutzia wanghongyangiae TaxID=3111451 RepID=UPI002DBE826B|nr:hypothetical protein [Adlercreutzia sp. R21]MEC4184780.1 hypothetical protein [Adlercreutzia sp. R21]
MTSAPNISPVTGAVSEMHGHGSDHPRDTWVLNLEATAALLIALGSLLTFAAAAGLISNEGLARWTQECLFPLQFPVFYFCSGYLYQRYRAVRTRRAWALNLRREAVVLLVPFAVFTVLGLAVGSLCGSERALTLPELANALFVQPIAPLGYFYTCLLLYAITPTPISRRNTYGLVLAALACKVGIVVALSLPATAAAANALPYAITSVAENWIWFAGGMAIALVRALPLLRSREKAWALGALWIATSIITFTAGWIGETSHAILDAVGILWVTSLFSTVFRPARQNAFYRFTTRYTMAFWLIAPLALRLLFFVLVCLGAPAAAPWACLVLGAIVCFGAPVAVMAGLSRVGKLGFIVYPSRYLAPVPAAITKNPKL